MSYSCGSSSHKNLSELRIIWNTDVNWGWFDKIVVIMLPISALKFWHRVKCLVNINSYFSTICKMFLFFTIFSIFLWLYARCTFFPFENGFILGIVYALMILVGYLALKIFSISWPIFSYVSERKIMDFITGCHLAFSELFIVYFFWLAPSSTTKVISSIIQWGTDIISKFWQQAAPVYVAFRIERSGSSNRSMWKVYRYLLFSW